MVSDSAWMTGGRGRPRRAGGWAVALMAAPLLVFMACSTKVCDTAKDTACDPTDADADGYIASVDCNEANAAVNPGADEICDDATDNDCDDFTDTADADCENP